MGLVICQGCSTELPVWTGTCPRCGNTEVIRMDPQPDRMIGKVVGSRYKILQKLGQGGMGAVYVGELVGIGQKVALKFLNAHLSADPDLARRFLNEAKSYARVSHPNAVILHDFGQDEEGTLFISMELVEGVDLQKLLAERGRLPLFEATEIVLQVAEVLGHAHSVGVIHRDLKPENIMIRKGARGFHVKVLDFGIARILEEGSTRLTAQGSIAGTPRYMSPEQADGKDVDERVDIYAVGVVLFELLTGIQPFDGSSITEILHKQIVTPMPHLIDVAPDLDLPRLDAVIQKATAKNRVERYRTMEEFAIDLSNAIPTNIGKFEARTDVGTTPSSADATLVRRPTPDLPPSTEADFRKTAWPKSPYAKRKTGPVLWVTTSCIAAAAALGIYFAVRQTKSGPGTAAAATETKGSSSTTTLSAARTETAETPAAPDLPLREELLTKEILLKANNEFVSGNINAAKTILSSLPKKHESEEEVVKFRNSLEDVSAKLTEARRSSSRGDCITAIKVYEQIIKAYPTVREARRGRDECLKMLPPNYTE